jgi:hypothetical protein
MSMALAISLQKGTKQPSSVQMCSCMLVVKNQLDLGQQPAGNYEEAC